MNQFYNPQGYQPYTGAGAQPARQQQVPFPGQPGYSTMPPGGAVPGGIPTSPPTGGQLPGQLPLEQSYIENILRLNKGKLVNVFTTFENNKEWNAKEFRGVIEAAGRDHLILSDPQSGERYLIPMVHLDYVTFQEPVEYEYPYGAAPGLATYPPR